MIEYYIVLKTAIVLHVRRGIGRHLLWASEELISLMAIPREVYLHCRMIDKVPLNMYKNAGYNIISTDSIFTLFMFQRRKHLMCKKLPEPNNLHLDIVGAGVKPASWRALLKHRRCESCEGTSNDGFDSSSVHDIIFIYVLPVFWFDEKCMYYQQLLSSVTILL